MISMRRVLNWIEQVGIDGLVVIVLSLIALFFSVYSFIGGNEINPAIIIGVLSLLLTELVLQRVRQSRNKEEIISSVKGLKVEVYPNNQDFAVAKYKLLASAKSSVFDTELCLPKSYVTTRPAGVETPYEKLLRERLSKDEIIFKYLHVIYDRLQFEAIIKDLLKFEKQQYYVGCFIGGEEVVPALNVMVFDEQHFLLGGYYGPSVRGVDRNLYIQHGEIGQTLIEYCNCLWSSAKILNVNRNINWEEVKRCALLLGYTDDEFNKTVQKIAGELGRSSPLP
jgi:hypothetical protein